MCVSGRHITTSYGEEEEEVEECRRHSQQLVGVLYTETKHSTSAPTHSFNSFLQVYNNNKKKRAEEKLGLAGGRPSSLGCTTHDCY